MAGAVNSVDITRFHYTQRGMHERGNGKIFSPHCTINKSQRLLHALFEMCIKMVISELHNSAANTAVIGQARPLCKTSCEHVPINFLLDIHVTVIFVRDLLAV